MQDTVPESTHGQIGMGVGLSLPLLLLATPFIVFLHHHSYGLAHPEVWISVAGILAAALICSSIIVFGGRVAALLVVTVLVSFFVDIQFSHLHWINLATRLGLVAVVVALGWLMREKFYLIVTAVVAMFFFVSLFELVVFDGRATSFTFLTPGPDAPPRIIHLILDEHIGVEGIPKDIASGDAISRQIRDFYLENGFVLFGNAFGHYLNTHHSVSNMVNLSGGSNYDELVRVRPGEPKTILRNEYFQILAAKGYRISVLSPGEIDYCSKAPVALDNCVNYQSANLRGFARLHLPTHQKLQVLASVYLRQSRILSSMLKRLGSIVPQSRDSFLDWTWAMDLKRTRMDALNTLDETSDLWREVLLLPRGTVLFAHLLLPHFPYVASADCSINRTGKDFLWEDNALVPSIATNNTPASRVERYQLYFQQIRCLYSKLDDLFHQMRAAGIYDDSIIVIHGDHGSRIFSKSFAADNQRALTTQDFRDGFSTLFAMKLPGSKGRYDSSPLPLEQLLANFLAAATGRTALVPTKSDAYVYLAEKGEQPKVRIPYPVEGVSLSR